MNARTVPKTRTLEDTVHELMQEIADLRQGVPFHIHRCGDHNWRCTSPYCESLEAPCLEHGGGPIGRPPEYKVDAKYVRGGANNV